MDYQERTRTDLRRSRLAFWVGIVLLIFWIPLFLVGAIAAGMHGPDGILNIASLVRAAAGLLAAGGATVAAANWNESPAAKIWTSLNVALVGVILFLISKY